MTTQVDKSSPIAAFFDLDRTLIDVNSAVLYARYEKRHGRISNWHVFLTGLYTALYHLNLLDMERAYEQATRIYTGLAEDEVNDRAVDFFSREVKHRLQPGAQRSLAEHRQRGHRLVLLTSSSSYQAAAACQAWGLDHWIANHFPAPKGYLLGTIAKPLCYAEGKVIHAQKWASEQGIDLASSYFYSDSFSDLPMLQAVGFPHVVNPDPRLRTFSKRQRWPILNWATVS